MNARRSPRDLVADRRVVVGAGAVVLALVLLAIGGLLGGWRPFTTEPDVLSFGPGGDMARFTLIEGQCARGTLGAARGFGPEDDAPCGEPHDVEVVASRAPLDQSRAGTYPGEDALARFGREFCSIVRDSDALAPEASGVTKDDLTVTTVIPSEAAFLSPRSAAASSAGSRQVVCVVSRSDGEALDDRFSVI